MKFHSSCIFSGKAVCTCKFGPQEDGILLPQKELQKIIEQKPIEEPTIVAVEVPALLKRKQDNLTPIINHDLPSLQSIQKTVERAKFKFDTAQNEKSKIESEKIQSINQINIDFNKAQDDYQILHSKRMKVGYEMAEVDKQIKSIQNPQENNNNNNNYNNNKNYINQFKGNKSKNIKDNSKQLLQKRDLHGNLINRNVVVKWEEDDRWWKAIIIHYDQVGGEALLYYPQSGDEEKINLKELVQQQSIAWDVKAQKPQYVK